MVSAKLGTRIVQGYGLTETVNFSTTMPPDMPDALYRTLASDANIPSVGTALYGAEVQVLDEDCRPVPTGQVGELCMRGHSVMSGYVANPEATEEAFRGGWFHSQDLGYEVVHPSSRDPYFVIVGRTKNIAKVAGESVSLDEVDRALLALPYIDDGASVAQPDSLLGEEIVVAVVVADDITDGRIRSDLGLNLQSSALPRRIVRLDAIPRTPTGKVLRSLLTDRLAT
jgi:acyl-CoA synthetase (AMP-forming)/AMP-acid ligase II